MRTKLTSRIPFECVFTYALDAWFWTLLYYLLLQWMVDEKELRVIHYTLGPLKPWDWWTAWLVKPVEIWQVILHFIFLLLATISISKES